MRTIPFGYRIEEGIVVVDEKEGKAVQKMFQLYLEGASLCAIRSRLDLKLYHQGIAHILENPIYTGIDYYPGIIERSVFDEVQRIRVRSMKRYAKTTSIKKKPLPQIRFRLCPVKKHLEDPFEQAQYIYSLISPKE